MGADGLLVHAEVSYHSALPPTAGLHADVIEPQRAKGYKSIWLVGISIGGFGALIHELARPGSVDGIVALAPYLGRRVLGAEIKKAGGLRMWQAPTGPQPDEEPDRKLWPFFQQYLQDQPVKNLPPLYLGFGLEDRFVNNHKLLADALPSGQVFTTEGGHDWPQWRQLWRNMLDVLPLPSSARARQPLTQSPVSAARPTASPWAIAA